MALDMTKMDEIVRGSTNYGYLAKARDVFPHIDQVVSDRKSPAFVGTPDDFAAQHKNDPILMKQMKNKVRKCANCGKPNAFTLPNCNQCGRDLTKTEISYTNNVFMGFVYGLEKGPFPFTISIRHQDEKFLVIDDLLAMTPCHLNAIPTTKYMADWTKLLPTPKEGKQIIEDLFNQCWGVVEKQFWANEAWRKKTIKNSESFKLEDLKKHLATGFNYPPSQYQLHLQFMLMPMIPFQFYLYLEGAHYTYRRFFPFEYVKRVFELNEPYTPSEDTSIDDIIEHFKTKGVDYDVIWKEFYDGYGKSHLLLANWKQEDFEGVISQDKYFQVANGKAEATTENIKDIQAADKVTLQNYGRPYNDQKKPTGGYYQFAKEFPDGVSML